MHVAQATEELADEGLLYLVGVLIALLIIKCDYFRDLPCRLDIRLKILPFLQFGINTHRHFRQFLMLKLERPKGLQVILQPHIKGNIHHMGAFLVTSEL